MIAGATGIGAASAQQAAPGSGTPTGPNGAGNRANPGLALTCSTTNYTDIAAKALGITSPALRLALVSGKSLSDLATSKAVDLTTVQTALKTAYEADLAQAVTSGLITQTEADQITKRLDSMPAAAATPNAAATPVATQAAPDANGNHRPGAGGPNDTNGPRGPQDGVGFLRIADRNQVSPFIIAAKAIGVSCPDLVKAVEGGQSIAQVATSKTVTAQVVIDALTAAEKAALAQDVTEGLITQAQADKQTANITARVTQMVNNTGMMGRGGPNGQGGQGGGPGNGQRGPGNGQGGPGNGQPPAAATQAAGSSS
jgi:hypothetical protein